MGQREAKSPEGDAAATAASYRPDASLLVERNESDINLRKAVFEIAIVAIGVLLALLVDEVRDLRADRALAREAKAAMEAELDQNRIRVAAKLSLLHTAYRTIEQDSSAAATLVDQAANFQITLTDVAWTMALETGGVRLLEERDRQALAYVYNSQGIYNQLLAEEMSHWTALAGSHDEQSIRVWKAYARRVAVGGCIASIRIERFRNPALEAEPLRNTCFRYRPVMPPKELYRQLGYPMPDTNWRPGGEF